ncbi:short chain dehydrogenase family protein [Paraburkholderia xenovorans LB400]|uniref:Short-chain dehydrogenase/reductase n=1 Tax=Paraburkholderia xenovorans (strain LB400) TaxID=266265 RepID=Q13I70_PARXL|nr:SDR family NAD(P)-dependent oxidoreductase [Paraburkholderia xenovorans]ABE36219.1 Putative short-chain dehydrogenase/reductase [Paraburkholderia xenovorans LB400]AIP34329.1 short chain dehydrogenase family protein [Paraburkholderia xenovorans LB400]
MNILDLKTRSAVVTGAAGAIGKAIAKRLLDSGAAVCLWDINEEAVKQSCAELTESGPVEWAVVDICDPLAVSVGLARVIENVGRIDILVNNAGVSGAQVPLEEYDLSEWRRVIESNLTGAFVCSQAVIGAMRAGGYGRIVNVASVAGKEGSPRLSAYSAAKAGMIAMTKSLGKELAMSPVLVNCVTPGPTRSRMTAETPKEQLALMLSKAPMQRMMEPHEVAAMVAWLCTEECSYTTGAVHDLSGGRSSY